MSDLAPETVAPFTGVKVYAVSPVAQYPSGKRTLTGSVSDRFEAHVMLIALLGGKVLKVDEEFMQVMDVGHREDDNDAYWGKDAILVTVASFHTGAQLSKALQQDDVFGNYDFIVFDRAEGKYFHRGCEVDLAKGLSGPAANDFAP